MSAVCDVLPQLSLRVSVRPCSSSSISSLLSPLISHRPLPSLISFSTTMSLHLSFLFTSPPPFSPSPSSLSSVCSSLWHSLTFSLGGRPKLDSHPSAPAGVQHPRSLWAQRHHSPPAASSYNHQWSILFVCCQFSHYGE